MWIVARWQFTQNCHNLPNAPFRSDLGACPVKGNSFVILTAQGSLFNKTFEILPMDKINLLNVLLNDLILRTVEMRSICILVCETIALWAGMTSGGSRDLLHVPPPTLAALALLISCDSPSVWAEQWGLTSPRATPVWVWPAVKPWDCQGYYGDLWTTLKTTDFINKVLEVVWRSPYYPWRWSALRDAGHTGLSPNMAHSL